MEPLYSQEPISHDYIACAFWDNQIAKVSKITVLPYTKNNETFYMAYINIEEWCDTESAFHFIKQLKDTSKETHLYHKADEWWNVEVNTHNNGELNVGRYTVNYDSEFFQPIEIITETLDPICWDYLSANLNAIRLFEDGEEDEDKDKYITMATLTFGDLMNYEENIVENEYPPQEPESYTYNQNRILRELNELLDADTEEI
jgi:hypothetical protein